MVGRSWPLEGLTTRSSGRGLTMAGLLLGGASPRRLLASRRRSSLVLGGHGLLLLELVDHGNEGLNLLGKGRQLISWCSCIWWRVDDGRIGGRKVDFLLPSRWRMPPRIVGGSILSPRHHHRLVDRGGNTVGFASSFLSPFLACQSDDARSPNLSAGKIDLLADGILAGLDNLQEVPRPEGAPVGTLRRPS